MAVAASRTRRIMLGSGVVSIPYHHPFNIANRFALLDHLTRGRVMLGCGPGALAADAHMQGIDTTSSASEMVEGVTAILRLFNEQGEITIDGSYFKLGRRPSAGEAVSSSRTCRSSSRTRFRPRGWSRRTARMRRAVGRVVRAGRPGDLPKRWAMAEESAAEHGKTVDRKNWRMVFPIHLRETRQEALEDIREGGNSVDSATTLSTRSARVSSSRNIRISRVEEMTIDRMVGRGGVARGNARRRDRADQAKLQQATAASAASWDSRTNGPAREDAALVRTVRALRDAAVPGHGRRRGRVLQRWAARIAT